MAIDIINKSRLEEIALRLEESHLLYLEADDSPLKLQQRRKLEGYIKEYLCLVPNENKYVFRETADILHRSASTLQDFSGYRACTAWTAISLYAANLLAQPWRKEYRTLRTYSGYYKHEVEVNLIGAELMFELMGYKHTGLGILTVEGPIDPDKVASVSRDAIVAFVECQILKQIWESVSKSYTISWLEILEFRENHVGTPEQAIRALAYRFMEKSQQHRLKADGFSDYYRRYQQQTQLEPTYSFPIAPNNYNQIANYQPDYHELNSGHIHRNQFRTAAQLPSSRSFNPYDDFALSPQSTKLFPGAAVVHANYSKPQASYDTCVPTGQLIELDPNPMHGSEKFLISSRKYPARDVDEVDFLKSSQKEKENSKYGSENWDFVYNRLEKCGYSKDLGDREDILRKKETDSRAKDKYKSNDDKLTYLTDKKKSRSMDYEFDNLKGTRRESTSSSSKKKASPERLPSSMLDLSHVEGHGKSKFYQTSNSSQRMNRANSEQKIKKLTESFKSIDLEKNGHSAGTQKKWNCATCTFLNPSGRNICEMCGKSRRKGNEDKPLISGGKECPNCTLVNEKDLSDCDACGCTLEGSPTYI